ncbi:MAG: hypothetical protein JKY81_01445 [Colwellia sp.]|nr:hypothetical protein [Colwellia sp.]
MALDDNFKQQFIYIAGAETAEQRDDRLVEVVSKIADGDKWFFRSLKTARLNHLSFINYNSVVNEVENYMRLYRCSHSAIEYMTPLQS